ncbi:TraB family protein [uncultured archaeon]|nr:TraB family protein [uncultured archaeon]
MPVYIIGTSHIARESVEKVKEAIKEKKPECIAVELDYNRYYAMLYKQRGEVKLPFLQKTILTLMQKLQENLSKQTNIFPGTEMMAAVEFATMNGVRCAFIDQDINYTVSRLMKKLGFFGKLKLLVYLIPALVGVPIKGVTMLAEIDLNKVPDEKLIERALTELKREFPAIYEVLIEERNRHMARNIRKLQEQFSTIVVVVGAGHVNGITRLLKEK